MFVFHPCQGRKRLCFAKQLGSASMKVPSCFIWIHRGKPWSMALRRGTGFRLPFATQTSILTSILGDSWWGHFRLQETHRMTSKPQFLNPCWSKVASVIRLQSADVSVSHTWSSDSRTGWESSGTAAAEVRDTEVRNSRHGNPWNHGDNRFYQTQSAAVVRFSHIYIYK